MRFNNLVIALPKWVESHLAEPQYVCPTTEERMQLVIRLARCNVEQGTGGPFGAAIFERDTGKLVAPGVNVVVPENCSLGHAEMVAIGIAQQALGRYDLGEEGTPTHELVTSTEPCAMCLGAIPWSGVRRVVCGARDADAREIGFDEGPKPPDWVAALEQRGIAVVRDILREQARSVLRLYLDSGGTLYNARSGDTDQDQPAL